MPTCTSEFLFGQAHMNDSGIIFNHRLTLYEGDRAVLVFERKPSIGEGGSVVARWVPHVGKFIDDSMVMMAAYGIGDETILSLIAEIKQESGDQGVLELGDVDEKLMQELYAASKRSFQGVTKRDKAGKNPVRWKVVACVFRGSSIINSLQRFHDYDVDIEVCQSVYQSEYSAWTGKIDTWGELD